MKKIVIKVNINCQICKKDVLRAATKLIGIDQISVEAEKGTLTVVGEVDPVLVIKRLRKIGKAAEITSVGPSQPSESEKKEKEKPKPPLPPCCSHCQPVTVWYFPYEYGGVCSIL